MRRNLDLIRTILLKVEEHNDPLDWVEFEVEGFTDVEVSYHIMLLDQAGLIEANDCSSNDGLHWEARTLTWAGHEFLDAARNTNIWKQALDKVGNVAGGVSFAVLVELLKKYALEAVGLAA